MLNEIFTIGLVLFLLLCAAYFSACETAITAYSRPKMYTLAKDGNKKAKVICSLQEDIGLVISAILTCNTMLNSFSVSLATSTCTDMFGDSPMVYFIIVMVMSVFVVFFAEVLPKMMTISNPERILLPSAYFIKGVFVLLRPLNNIIGLVAKKFLDVIGFAPSDMVDYQSSLDELRGAIDLHRGNNNQDIEQEKAMLKSVLDLGSVFVGKIMTHRRNVTMLCLEDGIESIINSVMTCPYTRIPIWSEDQDNIIGVLHVKDVLKAIRQADDVQAINVMSIVLKPWFIPENTDLLEQLQAFRSKREHFAIVVDEYGGFMGIVTLEDIIEEIVGDISDEHDIASANGIRKQKDGSYIVDGSVSVRDLNRDIGTNFPSDIAATIAGLIINSIRIIPSVGQSFVIHGYQFDILKRQRNQVTLLKIIKKVQDEDVD